MINANKIVGPTLRVFDKHCPPLGNTFNQYPCYIFPENIFPSSIEYHQFF